MCSFAIYWWDFIVSWWRDTLFANHRRSQEIATETRVEKEVLYVLVCLHELPKTFSFICQELLDLMFEINQRISTLFCVSNLYVSVDVQGLFKV
jgi:hypothetical protein